MYHNLTEESGKRTYAENQDSLTGVLKKSFAEAQIISQMREKSGGALFLCEVDHIKRINEQYGHPAGDASLKHVARILSYMIHTNDILSRQSGALFAIFMPDCQGVQRAEEYAQQINNRFAASKEKWNGKIPLSLTIVWVLREPQDSCDTLFDRADEKRRKLLTEVGVTKECDKKERDYYIKDIRQVRKDFAEQIAKPGAYCQDYETFKGIYRFLARGLIRSGQKACVILITLVNEEGGSPRLCEKDVLMDRLGECIANTLRIGDVYTRYSSSQYLLLVIDTTKRQADMIAGRIRDQFLAAEHSNDILT